MNLDYRYCQPRVIELSQYDTGSTIMVGLWNNGEAAALSGTISLVGSKPSGAEFEVACTYEGNIVTIPVTRDFTDEYGLVKSELRMTDGGKNIGTRNFTFHIERSPVVVSFGSVSGDVANFETAAAVPLQSLVAQIEPVQNLNGYDAPWPPGGGKNLADIPDSTVTTQATIASGIALAAGTYTVSCTYKNNSAINCYFYVVNESSSTTYVRLVFPPNASGRAEASFTVDDSASIKIVCNGQTAGYNFSVSDIMIEAGSSATDYAPYSNICQITGWTECSVTRAGANLLDEATNKSGYYINENGITVSNNLFQYSDLIPVVGNEVIIEGNQTVAQDYKRRVQGYDESGIWVEQLGVYQSNVAEAYKFTVAIPSTVKYIRYSYRLTETGVKVRNADVYTINWTTEAGTVYSGELNVTTGELTVDKAMYTFAGPDDISSYSTASTGAKYVVSNRVDSQIGVGLSNQYEFTAGGVPSADRAVARIVSSLIYIYDPRFTDLATAQALIAANPIQVLYPLSTPSTYQLTPTEIDALLGENLIWADTGDVIVDYIDIS